MSYKTLQDVIDICELQGETYGATVEFSIAAGASLETIFVVGSRPVIFFSRQISYYGDGVDTYIYRDAEYTGGALDIETFSSNDVIKRNARSYFINDATITNGGIQTRQKIPVAGNQSKQGNGAVLEAIDRPVTMLPNSIYRFVITNRDTASTQGGSSVVEFAEPDRIPGIIIQNGQFVAYNGEQL